MRVAPIDSDDVLEEESFQQEESQQQEGEEEETDGLILGEAQSSTPQRSFPPSSAACWNDEGEDILSWTTRMCNRQHWVFTNQKIVLNVDEPDMQVTHLHDITLGLML